MSDIDWTLTGIAIAVTMLYVVIASFVWALVPPHWNRDSRDHAASFWPLFLFGLFVYMLGTIGPRTVAWFRRPRLPKARVL